MYDPALDQAVQTLRAHGRIAMTIAELASALEPAIVEPAILERRLREDPRFVVLDGGGLPGLDQWPVERQAAYAAAFRTLDLAQPHLVLLASQEPGLSRHNLAQLLQSTVIRLVGTRAAPAVAAAAERVHGALAGFTAPGEGAPTTSLLPDPPPPP